MSFQIRIEGLGPVLSAIQRAEDLQGFKRGLLMAATYLKGRIAQYPAARHGPQPFKTDRQRRGFFAKLEAGEIEVPYTRGMSPGSQKLGQSWNVASSGNGMTVTVGTAVRYAGWVQDSGRQAFYHKVTGWKTVQQVGEDEAARVNQIIAAEVGKDVSKS